MTSTLSVITYGSGGTQVHTSTRPDVIVDRICVDCDFSPAARSSGQRMRDIQMIKNRYISTLLNFKNKQILNGINEIKSNYGNVLKFKDKLICLIIKKN